MNAESNAEINRERAAALVDDCLAIVDDPRNADPATLAISVERVQARLWLAARLDPETWGP